MFFLFISELSFYFGIARGFVRQLLKTSSINAVVNQIDKNGQGGS
jgi:uncharacterized membrane protein required for colicin V production